jgi:hypothetical protein
MLIETLARATSFSSRILPETNAGFFWASKSPQESSNAESSKVWWTFNEYYFG